MRTWINRLHRAEDALLVLLLSTMILLAGTQIILRNVLDTGVVWIDPLLRVMVLWLGLIGATVATRNNRHIRIDLLTKLFSRNAHRLIQSVVAQISAWTCLVIAWYGFQWVRFDYIDGITSLIGVPAWALEVVIPVTFGLMGLRFLISSFSWARLYWRHIKVAKRMMR